MEDFDEALDLDGDGEIGAFEMSILEEESKNKKGGNSNAGCCFVFLVLNASILMTGWFVVQVV